ncbi:hypothetical protein C2U59_07190 [Klebsiella pneumoniae]|nr:hypothetical protein [Klebsiella pneumoniae]
MLDLIIYTYSKLVEHFAAMTTLVFVATIFKITFPLVAYLINRIFEYRSYKRWLKIPGITEEQARTKARNIWRPKTKLPKLLLKLKKIIFTTKNN